MWERDTSAVYINLSNASEKFLQAQGIYVSDWEQYFKGG